MGWVVFIVVLVIIIVAMRLHHSSEKEKHDDKQTYRMDDQTPDNPMYEEMQEEFFDEFER